MMEKVRLPHEVVEALDKSKHMGPVSIMGHIARFGDPAAMITTKELFLIHAFYKENPYLIASALVNGYEVEETPEDKVLKYFAIANSSPTIPARQAIRHTLDLLNIKIKGVND